MKGWYCRPATGSSLAAALDHTQGKTAKTVACSGRRVLMMAGIVAHGHAGEKRQPDRIQSVGCGGLMVPAYS